MGTDPGTDGGTTGSNQNFARDAFGYTLNYFSGDYQAIDPNKSLSANNFIASTNNFTNLATDAPNLYNGNISSMVTTIKNPTTGDVLPQFTMYRYDQLNRLKNMKAFASFNFTNNEWNYSTYTGRYQNDFTYDANGNIKTQLRNDEAGNTINNLTYNRFNISDKIIQNRLYSVNDVVAGSTFTDDIDDQGTFNNTLDNVNIANNYAYDELGNLTRNTQKEIAEIKWTVYGKVQEVIRTNGSSKKNLKFEYNATGQRTAKHVYSSSDVFEHSDYYVYDASGNLMSVYRKFSDANEQVLSYSLTERPMYGSSRLGVDKTTIEFIGYTPPTNGLTNHVVGLKQYEGSNHLGNVLTTFSDKKIPVDSDNDGIIDYSTAKITSSTDYYPFGVTMKARDFTSNVSRFGFNGKEKDDETETMDFGARLLDGDLGVWLACDPLAAKYPFYSPYVYVGSSPMKFVDKEGREIVIVGMVNGIETRVVFTPGAPPPDGADGFMLDVYKGLNYLYKEAGPDAFEITNSLINSSKTVEIVKAETFGDDYCETYGATKKQLYPISKISWDARSALKCNKSTDGNFLQSAVVGLLHEMDHANHYIQLIELYQDAIEKGDRITKRKIKKEIKRNFIKPEKYGYPDDVRITSGSEMRTSQFLKQGWRDNYANDPSTAYPSLGPLTTESKLKGKNYYVSESKEELSK